MEDFFNTKIDNLLDFLKIKRKKDINGNFFYSTNEGKIYTKHDLIKIIRRILEIDKQCGQCGDWKFDYDLTEIEESGLFVCDKCAEKIISGMQKLK